MLYFFLQKQLTPKNINLNIKYDISNINEIFIIIKQILVSDCLGKKDH